MEMRKADSERGRPVIDFERSVIDPEVYISEEVYRRERELVFARNWQFVGHESQIPNAGDYIRSPMGEENVIVWRGDDRAVRVFLNSCPHRGMPLCRDDAGRSKALVCPYHGWSFNLHGQLRGVPMFSDTYKGVMEREEWGLIKVPRVETYRGLIFACFDENAESLDSYLGEMRWYLDTVFNRTEGGIKVMPGVHRWTVDANWKFGAENLAGDNAHVVRAHGSMAMVAGVQQTGRSNGGTPLDIEAALPNGHGWLSIVNRINRSKPLLADYHRRVREEAASRMTPAQVEHIGNFFAATVFPNFSLLFTGCTTMRVWQPLAHNKMQVWSWTVSEADAPDDVLTEERQQMTSTFSTSGMFEQDDGALWAACQRALEAGHMRRQFPLAYLQGSGAHHLIEDANRPGKVGPAPTEMTMINFYQKWHEDMGYAQ